MASTTSYIDGDGLKQNRAVRGDGGAVSPFEAYVVDADLNNATGSQSQAPASKSTLTSTGTTPYSMLQLLKGILINTGSSGSSQTQYSDGASAATPTGTVAMAKTSGGTVSAVSVDASGSLLVSTNNNYSEFSSGSVSVGTTAATVITVDVRNFRRMNIQIQNTGSTALAAFSVQGRYHSSLGGLYNPRAASTSDFTTNRAIQTGNATAFVYDASADLTTLAGSSNGWLELNVERYESVRIQAQVASGSTTLKIDGIAKNQ